MFRMLAPLLDRPNIPPSMFGLVWLPVLPRRYARKSRGVFEGVAAAAGSAALESVLAAALAVSVALYVPELVPRVLAYCS
jgi:hypothetical protein